MDEIVLSYVITTYNKLNYLKTVLEHLVSGCDEDEEIVIVDGGSTDGTVLYLNTLRGRKYFGAIISEKDHGEAHGFNKGLLAARGKLVKLITDDDVFFPQSIQACKKAMLSDSSIDLMGCDGGATKSVGCSDVVSLCYSEDYRRWVAEKKPFAFCGLGLMLRKSSLARLGLLSTGFVCVDGEFTLRVTAMGASLAWLAAPSWVRITNPASNSVKFTSKLEREVDLLEYIYLRRLNLLKKLMRRTKSIAKALIRILLPLKKKDAGGFDFETGYQKGLVWLEASSTSTDLENRVLIRRKT